MDSIELTEEYTVWNNHSGKIITNDPSGGANPVSTHAHHYIIFKWILLLM